MPLSKVAASEVRAVLITEYATELMSNELKSWQMRVGRLATPLQRYANSTVNRSMTARLLSIAAHEAARNKDYFGITRKECAAELMISLNAASTIMSHYVAEGWAVCGESSCKHFKASQVLIDSTDDYASKVFDLTPSSLVSNHQKLVTFDQIATSHLVFTDDS